MTEISQISDAVNLPVGSSDTIPNPTNSMIFFLLLTMIYTFLTIYNINSQKSKDNIENTSNNGVYNLIYIALLVIGTYFINLQISKSLCLKGEIIYSSVFFATILPWIIIFGLLYFVLELFPGWIKPFSNTIGYFIVNTFGLEKIMKDLLKSNKEGEIEDSTLKLAISKIDNNISRFINEIGPDQYKFEIFIEKLKKEGFLKYKTTLEQAETDKNIIEFFKLLNMKHFIGKMVWYVLAGTLISSISYNYIINIKCSTSLEESQKYYESIYQQPNNDLDGSMWKELFTYDERTLASDYNNVTDSINKLNPEILNRFDDAVTNYGDNGVINFTSGFNMFGTMVFSNNDYIERESNGIIKRYIPIA